MTFGFWVLSVFVFFRVLGFTVARFIGYRLQVFTVLSVLGFRV